MLNLSRCSSAHCWERFLARWCIIRWLSHWSPLSQTARKVSQVWYSTSVTHDFTSTHLDYECCIQGGLITTAFQIGNSLGLAICSIPQDIVYKRQYHVPNGNDITPQDLLHAIELQRLTKSLTAGLWTSMALAGVGVLLALVGIRRGVRPNRAKAVEEADGRMDVPEENS